MDAHPLTGGKMKKVFAMLILIFIGLSFLFPIFKTEGCEIQENETKEDIKDEEIKEFVYEEDAIELSIIYMKKELEEIEPLKEEDKLEWYKEYRNIVYKYRNVVGMPLTAFEFYTEDEIKLICKAVETECYGLNFESKVMVANVIFNRLESDLYSSDVNEVITIPNQFVYSREIIPEDTLYAVLYAYEIEDLTNGCLSFHCNEKTERFDGRSYVFTDKNSGHHFYK